MDGESEKMNRLQVHSSNLKSIGYNVCNKLLEIEFKDKGIYQYLNVPKEIYTLLIGASSHGRFFHRVIKNKFLTRKIK